MTESEADCLNLCAKQTNASLRFWRLRQALALLAALQGLALSGCGDDTAVVPGYIADALGGDDVTGLTQLDGTDALIVEPDVQDVKVADADTETDGVDLDLLFGDADGDDATDASDTDDAADVPDPVTAACAVNEDCVALSTPCSPAECVSGQCVGAPAADGAPCDDGDSCTNLTACKAGVCQGGGPLDCDDGNSCSDDACDKNHGCVHAFLNSGLCDDGDACTIAETCKDGFCGNGFAYNCEDGTLCTVDTCDSKTGCQHTNLEGVLCDDNNPCTVNDACSGGKCQAGAGDKCNDKNACTTDACDPVTGACTNVEIDCNDNTFCTTDACDQTAGCTHKPNTLPCDDKNACTASDTCSDGACIGLAVEATAECDDQNVCTTDTCTPQTGCQYAINTLPCEDGNLCTQGDVCGNGVCNSGPAQCACTSDFDCGQFEDGNLCNGTLYCNTTGLKWICEVSPITVVTCDAGADTACSESQCNTQTGKCSYVNVDEGLSCDADGTVCTSADTCKSGVCAPGAVVNCDDQNPCTVDSCDPVAGCQYFSGSTPCSDGNACTVGDLCKASGCVPGVLTQCGDGNVCTDDACDAISGNCVYVQNALPCDDGNACSLGDTCKSAVCSGTPGVCDDENPCTSDSCDPQSSCVHENNTIPCNDGNACTQGDVCGNGTCTGIPVSANVSCDDGNPCTTDACDPKAGCTHTNNAATCSDGNPCTTGDQCASGACVSGTNTCGCTQDSDCAGSEDGNLCNGTLFCDKTNVPFVCAVNPKTIVSCDTTADTICLHNQCDTKAGKCNYNPVAEGQPCDADGSICTTNDLCEGGACVPGAGLQCDDNNPCSIDSCDPKVGCLHIASTGACTDGNPCTQGDACVNFGCVGGAATVCNDSNVCTSDNCDTLSGNCIFANNQNPCNDGNACSQSLDI